MPTKLSKLADLNKIFPPIAVSSIVVATSCFYYYISYCDVEGNELCPRYIRVVFFLSQNYISFMFSIGFIFNSLIIGNK